ncbi:MAG: SDR family NAD(P)-dependent oxidoreductase [Deltaproteobacteria bacterium]|nr:SDR family NAD(P)-dependent oxidoreductase [Deltaproteobacteria bacterium]
MAAFDLEGKTIVITGASSGIGRALAVEFADKGAGHVVISGRNTGALDETAQLVKQKGIEPVCFAADVTSQDEMHALVNEALEKTGGLHAMVLCAGYEIMGAAENLDVDAYRRQMETNFFGVLHGFYAALPHFLEQGRGEFVFFNSAVGKLAAGLNSAYCASKFALTGFTDSIRCEMALHNINVLGVYPGFVKTNFQKNIESPDCNVPDDLARKLMGQTPEHVAKKVVKACCKRKGELIFTFSANLGIRLAPLSFYMTEFARAKIALPYFGTLVGHKGAGG